MTIQDKLYEKVAAEHTSFIEEVKMLPPEEIIARAYEITIKDDLLMCFDVGEVEEHEAHALFGLDAPLDVIYEQWMKTESSWHMDSLRECIEVQARLHVPSIIDSSITTAQRNAYGYLSDTMVPCNRRCAIRLFGTVPIYQLHPNNAESLTENISDVFDFDGIYGVPREDAERIANARAERSVNRKPREKDEDER